MKIAIVAANGKAGNLILKEAVSRGHEVLAIVRDAKKLEDKNVKVLEKDLFALTFEDVKDYDVVIDAFGTWTASTENLHTKSLMHLADILSNTDIRLLVIGGAGSLYVDPEHKIELMNTPDFPAEYKPTASAMSESLAELRKRDDVKWTYLSPAAMFEADKERTGKYIIGGEELMLSPEGIPEISYADYAIAMLDEAESGKHIKQRFTVVKG